MIKFSRKYIYDWGGNGYVKIFQWGEGVFCKGDDGINHFDTSKMKLQIWVFDVVGLFKWVVYKLIYEKQHMREEAAYWRGTANGIELASHLCGLTDEERAALTEQK